jgi:cellulose synthase/poly-beta-1,6-N-acetylglucosamine synthase-like glycosyltransferase
MIFYIFALICLLLALAYLLININYIHSFLHLPNHYYLPANPTISATIIVVARDESERILALLADLTNQDYPSHLHQIIIVDDHSQDNTPALIADFIAAQPPKSPPIRLLHLADYLDPIAAQTTIAFKKKAITYALQNTSSDWIVCTDADCQMPPQWLSTILAAAQKNKASAVLAPVLFEQGSEDTSFLLRRFQQLDLLGMMVVTAVGVQWGAHLANGANLAYSRAAFEEVGGFAGQENIASGDDMLLLHKIAALHTQPNAICFVAHPFATVTTALKTTWASLLSQRLRWATKSRTYRQKKLLFILSSVWLFSFSLFCNLIFVLFTCHALALYLLGVQVLIKLLADYWLLSTAARFFDRRPWLNAFLLAVWLHWAYILVVGAFANLIKKYHWKGRQVQ